MTDGAAASATATREVDDLRAETASIEPVAAGLQIDATGRPHKPLLRGWSHVVAFITVATLGTVVVAASDGSHRERWPLVIYVAGTLAMFGTSSLYHRICWRPPVLRVMSRLDHSAIFFAIAGAYTPVTIVALDGWHRSAVIATAWCGTAVGVLLEWLPVRVPRWLFTSVYVMVGWSALLAIPQFFTGLGPTGFGLLLGGGLLYTLGAVVYATRRPDPWPRVFGFHEVFHAFTLGGAGLHLAVIGLVVMPRMAG